MTITLLDNGFLEASLNRTQCVMSVTLCHRVLRQVDMDCELLTMLVSALKSNGAAQMKGLKFAKVLLETINKYGKQVVS